MLHIWSITHLYNYICILYINIYMWHICQNIIICNVFTYTQICLSWTYILIYELYYRIAHIFRIWEFYIHYNYMC